MKQNRKSCHVCGKAWIRRNLVSHAHNVSIRRAKPNLRRIRTKIEGTVVSVWICAKCLKRGKVAAAPARKGNRP